MNNEIKEIIEYFKDDIDFLEVELKHPEFKGRYITIRDKECEYLRKLLDYITTLQEENKNLKNEQISKYQTLKDLQEENEDLREENKEAHDFDETMKDIKENLIARINRQECEIHNLKAELEMYENGVYFSSENDKLQQRIDKAIEYLGINEEILETCEIYDVNGIEVYKILQGNKWNEVERAYLDDKPIGGEKRVNSNDLANVMGSFIETELNSFEELNKELEEKEKEIERLNNIINKLENHCETMLSIFEQMTDEDKQKELHKYLIYDDFLTRLKRLKGDSSNVK